MDYLDLTRELLQRVAEFDDADAGQGSDEMGFVRREVVQDFVERSLNIQLNPKIAEALNALTKNPESLRPEQIAPILEKIVRP